jgi:uncharacterized protein (TIGR02271 family)
MVARRRPKSFALPLNNSSDSQAFSGTGSAISLKNVLLCLQGGSMAGNQLGSDAKGFDDEAVVIGLFPYASDARWALQSLQEHHFTSHQIVAAFREPRSSPAEAEGASVRMRESDQWFSQLREIYRGDDRGVNRRGIAQPGLEAATTGFEAMLTQIDLSPQDALLLDHDLDRGAAIVTVKGGARNQEARTLLQQRGAHIVHGRHDGDLPGATEPMSATIVHSTPFNPPQPAEPDHIQLFGEVLRVRKEKVSGDVQVRKESVTHMETVQVPVTREHLVVEHSDARGSVDAERAIRVPLSEERVHVDKDTVLREEYKVGKREIMQNESVTGTVRRERLLIDDAGAKTNNPKLG